MKHTYYDKHGKEILAGMTIQNKDGETERVFATVDAYGNDDLGVVATNPAYAERHPDCDIEYYSLSNYRMSEWEIADLPEHSDITTKSHKNRDKEAER